MNLRSLKKMELEKPVAPPSPPSTMEDLPPEVLTKILEFVTLDGDRTDLFGCRLVNSQWKDILDSIISKRIVRGEYLALPGMTIVKVETLLYVRVPPTRFPEGRTQIPFNSLHFNGTKTRRVSNNDPESSYFPLLPLPMFASKYGGNLTTFSLRDQTIPINKLAEMLSLMPSLKRLNFDNVKHKSAKNVPEKPFRIPPPLTSLAILKLALPFEITELVVPSKFPPSLLYRWLVAAYADQLVHLNLESGYLFPALQTSHEYTCETRLIVTTSKSAFKKLKALKITVPTREFLNLSETPALQRFEVVESNNVDNDFELEDIITFLNRCSSSLETLVSNAFYDFAELINEEASMEVLVGHRPPFLRSSLVALPKLTTAIMLYPHKHVAEMVLSGFLIKFPALEKLHLIFFRPQDCDQKIPNEFVNNEAVEFGNENNQNADEIVTLKEQLTQLVKHMLGILKDTMLLKLTLRRLKLQPEEGRAAARRRLKTQLRGRDKDMDIACAGRTAILHRLAALGENTKKVMVEQLLERTGFWNTCPRLRIVSVSSAEKPNGDGGVFRRPDGC